jgi:ankyrin repeat protein
LLQEKNFSPDNTLDKQILQLLIEGGAEINTEAYFKLRRSDQELLYLLTLAGNQINRKNCNGLTPLHTAAQGGYAGKINALIKHGADVHETDNNGNCPLHLAALKGHKVSVFCLLKYGADHVVVNNDNKTAYELTDSPKIRQIIKEKESMTHIAKQLHCNNITQGLMMREINGK